jgi:hypothetical protein
MNRNDKPEHRSSSKMLPGNSQIQAIFILVIILIVALVTVTNVMMGDFTNLFIGLGVVGGALYIGTLWRYSWLIAIFLGMMAFSIAPTGFLIPSDFMCCGLAIGMLVTLLMRRALGSPPLPPMITPGLSLKPVVIASILFLTYVSIQGVMGEISPVYPGQYSLRNTAKAYAEDLMPPFTLILLIMLRHRLPDMSKLLKLVTPMMILVLSILCVYRLYQISTGRFDWDEADGYSAPLLPGINLIPNEFALRVVSPLAALWAASLLFLSQTTISRSAWLANAFLLTLALAGSILSAGRAIPALVVLGVAAMAFLSRRYGFLMASLGAFALFVAGVNVAGPMIDNMSFAVRRSVAMLRFDQNSDKDAISGSTTMREFLITEGMKELNSESRIFFTGRGVLVFTEGDARINASDAEYDKWMLAVRTGRLHRTSASQLIRYGVIGTILYYLVQLALLFYCWRAYRSFRLRTLPETSVAAFAFAVIGMNFALGFLQDGHFTNLNAWFVALVVGLASHQGIPVTDWLRSSIGSNPRDSIAGRAALASRHG